MNWWQYKSVNDSVSAGRLLIFQLRFNCSIAFASTSSGDWKASSLSSQKISTSSSTRCTSDSSMSPARLMRESSTYTLPIFQCFVGAGVWIRYSGGVCWLGHDVFLLCYALRFGKQAHQLVLLRCNPDAMVMFLFCLSLEQGIRTHLSSTLRVRLLFLLARQGRGLRIGT